MPFRSRAVAPVLAAVLLVALAPIARAGVDPACELVISLEAEPLGNETRMQRYEQILQDFADAIYESSEGSRSLGQTCVYTGGTAHDRAHVIWQRRGHPKSALNGIRGPGRIYMVDTFTGGAADGGDLALTDDPDIAGAGAAGAVLAHEWAHWAYGLLDEHVVEPGDLPVSPSLMHSPWNVVGNPWWASFSIAADGTSDPFRDTEQTAHHRAYGSSGWELLATAPTLAEALLSPTPGSVPRAHDEAVAMAAPLGEPQIDGAAPPIPAPIWRTACANYAIAIDNSGSMAGQSLRDAKDIASVLVAFAPADSTAVSILSFGSSANVRAGGAAIVGDDDSGGQSERERLLEAVEAIASIPVTTRFSAGLDAALPLLDDGAALLSALDRPECDPEMQSTALFFITDGTNGDPDGSEHDDLFAALGETLLAAVPIYVLDVDESDNNSSSVPPVDPPFDAALDTTRLAAGSGGIAIGPDAGLGTGLEALRQAETRKRPGFRLHTSDALSLTIPPGGPAGSVEFPVDEGLDRLSLCVESTAPVGSMVLGSPGGTGFGPVAARDTESVSLGVDDCSSFFAVESPPQPGLWTLTVTADEDATGDALVTAVATGHARDQSYTLDVRVINDSAPTLVLPEPVFVAARLGRELPLVGARVQASLGAAGSPSPLRDDGIPPDAVAGDGIYSGALVSDGELTNAEILVVASNALGIATLSSRGLVRAPGIQGLPIPAEPDDDLVGPLLRQASATITTVDGGPPGPVSDETPRNGRIAAGGEVDAWDVDLPALGVAAGTGDLEVRISGALLGMQPRLQIFDASDALIAEATAPTGTSGVAVDLQSSDGPVRAEVTHAGGGTGTYQISAGPRLGLEFGAAGLSDSPCDLALADKNDALAALEAGLDGVEAAIVLIVESRELERRMIEAIRLSPDDPSIGKAGRYLNRAAKRDTKALKRLWKAEQKSRGKELKGARRKIRNARHKLSKACARLPDGGESLLQP